MFPTTHWSVLAEATLEGGASGREALADLCRRYRPVILSHVRRRGFTREEAEDVTQEFFLALLRSRAWQRAEQARGRFRTFLLGMLEHVIGHRWEKERALKRGGGQETLSLDKLLEEGRELPGSDGETARHFDRQWAVCMVEQALAGVASRWAAQDREEEFRVLQQYLPGGAHPATYEAAGAALGLSQPALKSAIWRLRQAFRAELRQAVARTVEAPHEVDAELRHLHRALEP